MLWATTSVKMGWDVQGVHPSGEDGTHCNQVARSPDGELLVSCDDWGLVNVFRYPCVDNTSESKSYRGHSEHVVRAAFTEDS